MFIAQILPTYRTASILGTVVTIPAAIEMTLRIFQDLRRIRTTAENKKDKNSLSAHLGGALLYGLCGTNLIPGSAIIGAGIFTLHASISSNPTDLTSRAVREIGRHAYNDLLKPVWTHLVNPVAQKIYNTILAILRSIHLRELQNSRAQKNR